MTHFDEKTIRETAYYIWKNNGCQAGTSQRDWEEAVNLLERKDALTTAGHIFFFIQGGLFKHPFEG